MKFLFVFGWSLFLGVSLNAQTSEILFYLPDSVEININNYFSLQKSNVKFYCILRSEGRDTFSVSVCQYQEKERKNLESWVFITNRRVVINKCSYPLLLDYDYRFSTLDSSKVGVYGDRADKLIRLLPIAHCFNIKFTKFYILNHENKPIGNANKQHSIE